MSTSTLHIIAFIIGMLIIISSGFIASKLSNKIEDLRITVGVTSSRTLRTDYANSMLYSGRHYHCNSCYIRCKEALRTSIKVLIL